VWAASGQEFAGDGEEVASAWADPEMIPQEMEGVAGVGEVLCHLEHVVVGGEFGDGTEGGEVLFEEAVAPGPEETCEESGAGIEAGEEQTFRELISGPAIMLVRCFLECSHGGGGNPR
jgi:hypothetical protein